MYGQANVASVDTHIPGSNVNPTVRSATTVKARNISLASIGNHTNSADNQHREDHSDIQENRGHSRSCSSRYIHSRSNNRGKEDSTWTSRRNSHSRVHKPYSRSRSTCHNRGRCLTPYNGNYSWDNVTLNTQVQCEYKIT